MNYPNQHTPIAADISKIWNFKACPDGLTKWEARQPAIAKGMIPTIYELISSDAADDEILKIVNSGGNGLWGCG